MRILVWFRGSSSKLKLPWAGYMKQLRLKAQSRLFGKIDPASSADFSYVDPPPPPPNFAAASSSANYNSSTLSAVLESDRHERKEEEEQGEGEIHRQNQSHQRHESMCNLLDYEEHIMRRRDQMDLRQEIELKDGDQDQLPVIALMLTTLRRSLLTCATIDDHEGGGSGNGMDISWPTNVRHVTHVTFDRFNGFLGLPVEFEVEIPRRAPSASANVFGVSPESMQCSYDSRGNSVPTILLRMQDRLYSLGGLKAEGIFRINAENSHEEHVREQLNKGIVPFHIDLHCLAGLIKAWFRELPTGVLDTLSPEQVMQCHTEEQCVAVIKLLPPMQAALLDWAINLMADVAQEEAFNKMNARNVGMVFAPNMTQMADPLTALMHAVQVMNLLKTLILRTIRDRQEVLLESGPPLSLQPPPRRDATSESRVVASLNPANSNLNSSSNARGREDHYDDYSHCARSHSKQSSISKARGGSLVNRIDQHVERVEAW
ncbi:rho GTPase-activating protein 1 isoform X1 [Selaginella moellendorffii]|uniref:rho GTPase-activating protein 1 isoform X1 n=2 Tax=Selaginella moellendorffii TaxID=88036 RepID=UPI000D1C7340|nr:rho GTPase-activating protein 1 isoform X1 [Selaginella moellendorffii]|eukprot:XP_024541462.1 rho GTPase-activating protein 1 isoform X1 [Selaginella moellendorffii]